MGKRLAVGLTGSFGTGKSTVSRILENLGARKMINADQLVHEVFKRHHPIGRKIKSLFHMSGILNRKKIAGEVFRNPAKRRRLEALIHPYVRRRMLEELKSIRDGIAILEVPLLFEAGFDRLCDVTVSVLASERTIIRRLAKRGFASEEVKKRLETQLSQSEKKKRSDFFIINSGSKKLLVQKTKSVWKKLQPSASD
ncbi:MAG TPA: dephospho-CoA kinase [Candidatus Omnitrophota bacterium]|nr:dephospho-CoA kinase [Candidatus Omnitrophota bacterium]